MRRCRCCSANSLPPSRARLPDQTTLYLPATATHLQLRPLQEASQLDFAVQRQRRQGAVVAQQAQEGFLVVEVPAALQDRHLRWVEGSRELMGCGEGRSECVDRARGGGARQAGMLAGWINHRTGRHRHWHWHWNRCRHRRRQAQESRTDRCGGLIMLEEAQHNAGDASQLVKHTQQAAAWGVAGSGGEGSWSSKCAQSLLIEGSSAARRTIEAALEAAPPTVPPRLLPRYSPVPCGHLSASRARCSLGDSSVLLPTRRPAQVTATLGETPRCRPRLMVATTCSVVG